MPTFTAEQLRTIGVNLFEAVGVPKRESEIVCQHLVEASLAGVDSHGVIRIPQYVEAIQTGRISPGAKYDVVQETPSSALINGNRGFGQVIAQQAISVAIQKARNSAISAVSVHNCGHLGWLAGYTMMAADEELIGMMMVNAGGGGQTVAPFGGTARRLATNPISIAVPSPRGGRERVGTGKANPIVLDIATSVAPEGKIRAIRNRGEQVPEGWIVDHKGRSTTNPDDFYGPPPGALLPLGGAAGHKGFGLGFIIDILAGGLSGAGCSRADTPQEPSSDGALVVVIDIQKFTPLDDFYSRVAQLVAHVKSSPTAPGFDEIVVPGEPESREREKRLRTGIFVDETVWRQIRGIMEERGISR